MSAQTWVETLTTAQVDGPTLSTFTTAATILPSAAIYTFPANYFYIGRRLHVKASGRISTFTSGTFTVTFTLGTLGTPITVAPGTAGSAMNMLASQTNATWQLDLDMTVRAIGSGTSSTILGIAVFGSNALAGSTSGAQATSYMLPTSAPVVGNGFDSTITQTANLFVACSVSNASNAITLHQYSLESYN
jgi:hypothetical protein